MTAIPDTTASDTTASDKTASATRAPGTPVAADAVTDRGLPLDPALDALATEQHGMLTTAQLRTAGLEPADIVALVKRDILIHPGRGLYAVAAQKSPDAATWHRQLVAGAFLLYPDAILTGISAILANSLPVWDSPIARPTLVRPRARTGGMSAFHIRRKATRQRGADSPWGPCVDLAEALVQHAMDNGLVQGVVSLDAALHTGKVTEDDVAAVIERVAAWPRVSRARSMLKLADGRRETPGESRTGVMLSFLGYDVIPQFQIFDQGGRLIARVDFLIKGTRVIIEFDGKIKYADDDGTALFDEKKREDLLRSLGYVVVRLVWSDLNAPAAVDARIRRALAIAAR
ncbi:MAG: type IV toxin-antitoxin system AbiEi family antitoxin domain-containing protein [Actinomycetia bacterium]|nr:type IV toxin-antitoxin system AbiEi family antitoxin domain-containing protein [Actinomycetes bacterium]